MTFIHWLQKRLVIHGHKIDVDGVIGPQTRTAMLAFQIRLGLKPTSVADAKTIVALRLSAQTEKVKEKPEVVPTEDMPPWMDEMVRRMGLHEGRNNKSLSEWLRGGRWLGNPAKLPWCGDAVETCMVKTVNEPVPNNPFWAQAWAEFGRAVNGPIIGSVGVIRWSPRAGHVGFVADNTKTRVKLVGGNQSNMVNLAWFPKSKFIAFRWPNNYPVKKYPPFSGNAKTGSVSGTR